MGNGWELRPGKEIPYGEQFIVKDGSQNATVNFYHRKGNIVLGGPASNLKSALDAWLHGKGISAQPATRDSSTGLVSADFSAPHVGMDEAGKGDWFGALVVAAVYADARDIELLRQAGVRDSKQLAAKEVARLAAEVERIIPLSNYHVKVITPGTYNELYAGFQNINLLLSAAYAEVADSLLKRTGARVVVCDQFATSEERLASAFAGRGLPAPVQLHGAESASIVVAAASVLASAAFLCSLTELGAAVGLGGPLPKGSSDIERLESAARTIIDRDGPAALGAYAKTNFKPIRSLLSQPAPGAADGAAGTVDQYALETTSQKVLLRLPSWIKQHHEEGGFLRFRFDDGAILDWYLDRNGRLDVRGNPEAPSFSRLKEELHGKTLGPGDSPTERHRVTLALEKRLAVLIPDHQCEITRVATTGWQQLVTLDGVRFDFTDGAVLRYYESTKTLLIQGAPSEPVRAALSSLPTPFRAGRSALVGLLKELFPDWQLVRRPAPGNETAASVGLFEDAVADSARRLDWRPLWPADRQPRDSARPGAPCQADMLDDWSQVIANRNRNHMLAHAPTGIGKTLTSLVPALAWVAEQPGRRRVYYMTNRVLQHENPLRELKGGLADLFAARAGEALRVVDLPGRTALCLHPDSRPLHDACKRSLEAARFDLLPRGVNSGHEVARALDGGLCPYHTLQALMGRAHVVICDYWWLFSEVAQASGLVGRAAFSPESSVLIVDEAHNLPLRVRRELDVVETPDRIRLDLQGKPAAVRNCLEPIVAELERSAPDSDIPPSSLKQVVGGDEVLKGALETLEESVGEGSEGPATISERILRRLLRPDGDVVVYPTLGPSDETQLVFRLVDPTGVLRGGYSRVHASLSMSGTLAAPSDDGEELRYQVPLFGLPPERTLTRKYESPFPLVNQRWTYSADTLGTYRERDKHLDRYVEHISRVGRATPGAVTGVFFNSYQFLRQVLGALDSTEASLVVAERSADAEAADRGGADIGAYETRLREKVNGHGRGYLFAVYQGKLAEGASFAGNLIKSVVCVSIPLEYPGRFHERLHEKYQDLFKPICDELGDDPVLKAREYARDRLSLSLVLQACGRGIRGREDRCAFVLLDKRYDEYDWRRFLLPAPYNLTDPSQTVRSFHEERRAAAGGGWDRALLAACRKD